MGAVTRSLFDHLIDYAGLFPPAALSMRDAARNYARYLASADAWMLGRFVVPAVRLDELSQELDLVRAADGPHPTARWSISTLIGAEVIKDVEIARRCAAVEPERFVFDSFEVKANAPDDVASAVSSIRREFPQALVFVEVTPGASLEDLVRAVKDANAFAKVRTGGVIASAIPSRVDVADFLTACARLDVPFKATAGLHHARCGSYPLTYEADASRAPMHGFLNVWAAAASARADGTRDEAMRALEAAEPAAPEGSIRSFALSFGSCSFTEPVQDLRDLGLIGRAA